MLARVSEIARHAEMFDKSCPFPCEVSVPSFKRTTVGCYRENEDISYRFTVRTDSYVPLVDRAA